MVVIEHAEQAPPLCEALSAGGVPCAEITLRTPAALEAIATVADRDGFTVGAGTVLDARQARDAIAAGARFLVSPGFDDGVVSAARERDIPVLPGIATATEAQRALNAGVRAVKFFPASTSGGIPAVKALSAPFGSLTFLPTGGITMDEASDWLAIPAVVAVGGSWMTPPKLLSDGRYNEVERITRQTLASLDRSRTQEAP